MATPIVGIRMPKRPLKRPVIAINERYEFAKKWSKEFRESVIGNEDAIETIIDCVNCYLIGMGHKERPVGIFLLAGTSGSGKTFTAQTIAKSLHGNTNKMIRIDCSEYQHSHEIAKIIGAPPGYLGHRETEPVLTQAKLATISTTNCSISVILFDEIEKASDSLHDLLLGLLDYGKITLGNGSSVDLSRCLILMTTNLGARETSRLFNRRVIGFDKDNFTDDDIRKHTMKAIRTKFKSEFVNRLDKILIYKPFTNIDLESIVLRLIKEFETEISRNLMRLVDVDLPSVVPYILQEANKPEYGAREIRRLLETKFRIGVANAILNGEEADLRVSIDNGEVVISPVTENVWDDTPQ